MALTMKTNTMMTTMMIQTKSDDDYGNDKDDLVEPDLTKSDLFDKWVIFTLHKLFDRNQVS